MNRNYAHPTIETTAWCDGRETHPAVGAAIHAIADDKRSAEDIWESPTATEFDHVTMAVEEYLAHGDFEPTTTGRYMWGQEAITLPTEA